MGRIHDALMVTFNIVIVCGEHGLTIGQWRLVIHYLEIIKCLPDIFCCLINFIMNSSDISLSGVLSNLCRVFKYTFNSEIMWKTLIDSLELR